MVFVGNYLCVVPQKTFVDIAAIPVDIARGDWVSAGLDTVGVIPFIGEAADTARLAKKADKAIDAAKAAKAAKKAAKTASVSDNAKKVSKKYGLKDNGFFGTKGKNSRIFKCDDPLKESADFYSKISKGGKEDVLPNGKGVRSTFEDGSRVVYRKKTSTPDSPAVEISITIYDGIKKQKIHFIK